jgi:hypothetical protein
MSEVYIHNFRLMGFPLNSSLMVCSYIAFDLIIVFTDTNLPSCNLQNAVYGLVSRPFGWVV